MPLPKEALALSTAITLPNLFDQVFDFYYSNHHERACSMEFPLPKLIKVC